jgi:hypothetical protein
MLDRKVVIVGVGAVVLLTGCTGGIFGPPPLQNQPPTLVVENAHNTTYTFEVWIINSEGLGENMTITERGGVRYHMTISPGLSTYKWDSHSRYVNSITFPSNLSTEYAEWRLRPGEYNESDIPNFRRGSTIAVAVSHDGRYLSLVTANCDRDLPFFEVIMYYYGTGSAYNC